MYIVRCHNQKPAHNMQPKKMFIFRESSDIVHTGTAVFNGGISRLSKI